MCSESIRYTVIFLIRGGENLVNRAAIMAIVGKPRERRMNKIGKKVSKKILSVVFVVFMALVMIAGSFSFAAGETNNEPTETPQTVWTLEIGEATSLGDRGYYLQWEPGYWGKPDPQKITLRQEYFKLCKPEKIINSGSKIIATNQHAINESVACWSIIEQLIGHKPIDRFGGSKLFDLRLLRNSTSTLPLYIYVSNEGAPFALGDKSFIGNEQCEVNSLVYAGWARQPFFTVDIWQKDVWNMFYQGGMTSLLKKLPEVPDFCGDNSLVPTKQPDWIRVAKQNDMYRIDLSSVAFQIHTDNQICDQYVWRDDQVGVVSIQDYKKNFHPFLLTKGDLIVLKNGTKFAIVRIVGTELEWLKPLSNKLTIKPAVEITAACEGGLCGILYGSPDPYMYGDNPFTQTPAFEQ